MGQTNRTRITAYVSDEVAARLEEVRRERGVRSLSTLVDDILTQFATGKEPPKVFDTLTVAQQHPELVEDAKLSQPTQPVAQKLTQLGDEDAEIERLLATLPPNSSVPGTMIDKITALEQKKRIREGKLPVVAKNGRLVLDTVNKNYLDDVNNPKNAPPQVPARDTPGLGLVVKPETMPGVNSTIESGTPSAPTDAEFTTAPPTPVGSNEPPAEQTPDYFGWRSEQAR